MQRQTTKNLIKVKKKKGEIVKKCPSCRSSRITLVDSKQWNEKEKCIIHLKGIKCLKCGFKNMRRLKDVEAIDELKPFSYNDRRFKMGFKELDKRVKKLEELK